LLHSNKNNCEICNAKYDRIAILQEHIETLKYINEIKNKTIDILERDIINLEDWLSEYVPNLKKTEERVISFPKPDNNKNEKKTKKCIKIAL